MEIDKKAIVFARVSSREQEETGYSLPAQEKFLKNYCQQKGFEIAEVFSISESASPKSQRETFNKMIRYARKHSIKNIVCEKVDRLTRTFKHAVLIDDWLAEDDERHVHLVKDSLVLHKNSLAHEKLNWGVRVLFAKNYIDNLSEEVRKGLREKVAQGWQPNRPPLGYRSAVEDGHTIQVIDPETGPIIRRMFELYATGDYSLAVLVERLYSEGLRTSKGKKIQKSRVHSILTNPFYWGMFRWGGQRYNGNHDPLVSRDVFEAVQEKLTRNIKGTQYKKHLPLFKGKMHCGECGGLITWENQKGHWYGHCNGYRKCSQRVYIRQEAVEARLMPLFDVAAPENEQVLGWIIQALKQGHGDKIANVETQKSELNKALARAERRLEAIYDDKIDGRITLEFYEKRAAEYQAEKDAALDKLLRLAHADTKFYELGVALHELAAKAKVIYLNPGTTVQERRLLLSYAFSNITLEGREITPKHTLAFQFLAEWVPQLNRSFEPAGSVANKGQKAPFVPSCPIRSAWLDGFRTYDWSQAFPYPDVALKEVRQLSGLV